MATGEPSYRIVRSKRNPKTEIVVAQGIAGFGAADKERNRLQSISDEAHPEWTSWTKALYIVEREDRPWPRKK